MTGEFAYCPICQLPLKAILIAPDIHVSQCMRRFEGNNEECPNSVECLSTDVFHYRDYNHNQLAAYRASADFVPPDIEIKPAKKRRTPRKSPKQVEPGKSRRNNRTPLKTNQKDSVDSDGESDTEVLIPPKRVCKSLSFTKSCLLPKQTPLSSGETLSTFASNSRNDSPHAETEINKSPAEELRGIEKKSLVFSNRCNARVNNVPKLTLANVKMTSHEDVSLSNSRSPSPSSSISLSTQATSRVDNDSDCDYESLTGSTSSAGSKPTMYNLNSKFDLKKSVLKLTDIGRMKACNLGNLGSENITNGSGSYNKRAEENSLPQASTEDDGNKRGGSSSLQEAGHCDPAVNKKALKILRKERSTLDSLLTESNLYSENCIIDDNVEIRETVDDLILAPSSPEVVCTSKNRKKHLLPLVSSSDSDLPLAVIARNIAADKSKDTFMFGNERDGERCKKSAITKTHEQKEKFKAGKLLRESARTPLDSNGPLRKRMLNEDIFSDRDSDSLKSFLSNGDPSYATSEDMFSQVSDSAVSTDELTPSYLYSSTFTTPSDVTSTDTKTTDGSYSRSLDVSLRSRHKITPTKNVNIRKPVLSQSDSNSGVGSSSSASSDISKKEEILFGKRKKSPLKIKSPKKPIYPKLVQRDNTESDGARDKSKWRALIHKMRENCFPSDLKIDSEDSLTVASSCSGSDTSHASTHLQPQRQCPFYKRIPDTPFAVDAFQYWNIPGVKVYFLSHFHSDHYIGIKKSFAQPIYCSQVTASLVRMKLRVDEKWLRVMELNTPQVICGVEVTALDANHCPGSFMFLFSLRNGKNYLHVGDFRASKAMTFHPSLQRISISKLFLDTTYCSPQYCFPTQEEVIGKVIDIVRNHVKNHPNTLVACGSYTIGKEKMFLGVAEALDWKVWARPEKQRVFGCLSDPRVSSRLVRDPRSANVHVLPMQSIKVLPLQQHVQSCSGSFTHVIGIKPTGWELDNRSQQFKVTSRDNITVYGVPYSEHSSFSELRDFVQFLQPLEIVPTVNVGSAASREKMNKHFSEWMRPQDSTNKAGSQTKVSQFFKLS